MTGRAGDASAAFGRPTNQRLSVERGEKLVAAGKAAAATGGEDDGGNGPRLRCRRLRRLGDFRRPCCPAAGQRPAGDLSQEPADAHPHDVGAFDRKAGKQPFQDPIAAVRLGRARAAGQTDDAGGADRRQHQKVAGIDGHAEVEHVASEGSHRRWHHVAAIDDGGRPEDEDRIAAVCPLPFDRRRHRRNIVGGHRVCGEAAAEGFETGGRHLPRRLENARLDTGEPGLHQPRPVRAEGGNGNRRPAGAGDSETASDGRRRCGERDDLHRGQHLAGRDAGKGREGGEGDGLVDEVDRLDPPGIDVGDTGFVGEQVAAAGRGGGEADPGAG